MNFQNLHRSFSRIASVPIWTARRILVAGSSGSGKTFVSRALASALGIPYESQDALYFSRGWLVNSSFLEEVDTLCREFAWITEFHYEGTEVLIDSADLLIWLRIPKWHSLTSLTYRTIWRRISRSVLWNGAVQGPLWREFFNREGIVRWAWSEHAQREDWIARTISKRPDLPVLELRSRREVNLLLSHLTSLR